MTTLFLSYAGADRAIATALKEGLIRAGFDQPLWQDIDQIRGGDNWLITLKEALRDCSGYVIVVGPGGIHRWVRFELYAAIRRYFESNEQFPVFPVLLPGASPQSLPSFLSIIQAEKLPDHPEPEDYQRLAAVLARLLAKHGAEAAPTDAVMLDRSPWPGLVSYDRSLERFFFGRPTEILEALKRLGSVHGGLYRRWLQVEGPSGGGKSSLVLAGVLPAIERGWLGDGESAQSEAWLIAVMRPGSSPIDNLATELAKVLPGWRGRAVELKTSFLKPDNDEALKWLPA
ncbi:MAG: toll/interleukin-1 receptor domain-containing protein [Proteobacteria bacterium]|nr:toll/interleukin-1 receptor domain-containing protein [Pseudomonadota bacterium]